MLVGCIVISSYLHVSLYNFIYLTACDSGSKGTLLLYRLVACKLINSWLINLVAPSLVPGHPNNSSIIKDHKSLVINLFNFSIKANNVMIIIKLRAKEVSMFIRCLFL